MIEEGGGMNRSTLCALTAAAHQLVMMGVVAIAMPKREKNRRKPSPKKRKGVE